MSDVAVSKTLEIIAKSETSKAEEGIKNLANQLNSLKSTLSNLSSSTNSLKEIVSTLRRLSKIELKVSAESAKNMSRLVNSAKALDDATVKRFQILASAIRQINKINQKKIDIANNATNKKDNDSGSGSGNSGGSSNKKKRDEMTSDEQFDFDLKSKFSVNNISKASTLIGIFTAIIKYKIKTIKKDINSTISVLRKLGNIAKRIGSVLVNVFKSAASVTANLAKSFVGQFTKPVTNAIQSVKSAFSGLFRIAYYRAFRSLIKMITSGFSTGLENMYYWASTSDSVLKASMDSLATSAQYLKNSLAAMVAPLINAVAPVIEQITDQIANLFNMVGKFIAYLTGQSTYTAAVRVPATYADALDDAADSANNAKKASQWLLGIDELNILPDDTDTSTGSGSSGKTYADYANMFQTLNTDNIPDWLKTIKEMWQSGEYAELGTYLADLLNNVVDSWDSYTWAKNLGKKIQNGITVALNFLKRFSFKNLGKKFGFALRGLMESISANDLGSLIATHIMDALEFASGTLATAGNWGGWVADLINGWFEEFDGAEAAADISSIIRNIINNTSSMLNNISWEDIKADISGFWNGFDFEGIWTDFKTLLGNAEDVIFSLTGTSSWGELAEKVAGWISNAISSISAWWKENKSDFQDIWDEIKEGIAAGFGYQDENGNGSAWDEFGDGVFDNIVTQLQYLLTDLSSWFIQSGYAKKIGEAIVKLSKSIDWAKIRQQFFSGLFSGFFTLFNPTYDTSTEEGSRAYTERSTGQYISPEEYHGYYTGTSSKTSTKSGTGTSTNPVKVYVTPTTTSSTPTVGEVLGTTRTTKSPLQANTVLSEGTGYVALPTFVGTEQTKANPLRAATILTKGTGYTSVTNLFGLNSTYYVGVTPYLTTSLASLISGQTVTVGTTTTRVYGTGTKTTTTGNASIMFKANGGFVDEGQLFVANEKGAEMVGSMDGKTAVANNGQIVEGIQQGVYNAMMRAMSSTGGSNGNVSVTLNLDGKTVYDSVLKQNKDTYNRTGRNPLTAY